MTPRVPDCPRLAIGAGHPPQSIMPGMADSIEMHGTDAPTIIQGLI